MTRATCMPFSGLAGQLLMASMGILSILVCVLRYTWEHRRGIDRRPVRVYMFDMSKIAISQSAAWLVNLWITDQLFQTLIHQHNALAAVSSMAPPTSGTSMVPQTLSPELQIEGIGWYAAVFLMDFMFGVPCGIWLGRVVNRWADGRWAAYLSSALHVQNPLPPRSISVLTMDSAVEDELLDMYASGNVPENAALPLVPRWSEQNRIYGKYSRYHTGRPDDTYVDAWGPELDAWWWASQTTSWSCCVGLSRVASGVLTIFVLMAHNTPSNPVVQLASAITNLPLTCGGKQWLIAGLVRILVDILQLLIIDAVNKFRTKDDHESI